ncbi:MAG: ribbon-helix-helix domain-containing protein [Thermoplasmata archaeon]|jgi:Arc/MetJ-type ribon-helix-helix transcriptional regulator
MNETSERVTVRIPEDLLEKLRRVQEARGIATVSDAIREGLERYVEMHLPPPNVRKVVVELSRQDNRRLEEFVREGSSISIDDAVRSAVREFIRTRLDETHPRTGAAPRRDGELAEALPPRTG